jgi:hypothetical protein
LFYSILQHFPCLRHFLLPYFPALSHPSLPPSYLLPLPLPLFQPRFVQLSQLLLFPHSLLCLPYLLPVFQPLFLLLFLPLFLPLFVPLCSGPPLRPPNLFQRLLLKVYPMPPVIKIQLDQFTKNSVRPIYKKKMLHKKKKK